MEEGLQRGVTGKPGEESRTRGEQQRKPSKQPPWRNWKDLSGIAICIAVAVLCLGGCIVVFVRTSELHSRIVSLEQQRDAQLSSWMLSLEQVEPVILGRLDQILEEVRASFINWSQTLCHDLKAVPWLIGKLSFEVETSPQRGSGSKSIDSFDCNWGILNTLESNWTPSTPTITTNSCYFSYCNTRLAW